MKLLAVVTPPTAIYHGCFTRKKFWEDKFTPVNMKSCGRRNVRKHRKIKNGEKYIRLDISYQIYCLDKREVTFSWTKDYMGRSGKGLNTSLNIKVKRRNKKQNIRTVITDITNQYFRAFLREYKNHLIYVKRRNRLIINQLKLTYS